VAQQTMKALKVSLQSSAFVLDDSIKMRSGKKMPGVSRALSNFKWVMASLSGLLWHHYAFNI